MHWKEARREKRLHPKWPETWLPTEQATPYERPAAVREAANTGREAANTGRDFGLYLGKISFQILLLWDLTPGTKLS